MICCGDWIGELQDKKVSTTILFVITYLLPQNRLFGLNKMHLLVLKGGGVKHPDGAGTEK